MNRSEFTDKWGYSEWAAAISKENGGVDSGVVADMIIEEISVKEGWKNRKDSYAFPEDFPWTAAKADLLTLDEYKQYAE